MLDMRQVWADKLEAKRKHELLGPYEFAKEIGIQYLTYKKLIDPSKPPMSLSTMRKVRDYIAYLEEEES